MNPSRLAAPFIFALSLAALVAVSLRAQPPIAPAKPEATPKAPAAAPQPARRFGLAEPIARPKSTLRLATYNLENLFDDKDDPALTGDLDDAKMTKPADQCAAAAAAIKKLNADILAVQEIESYEALIQFRDRYLADLGYDHVVSIDAGDPRGIECGVLSRYPLKDPKVWRDLPLVGKHPDTLDGKPHPQAGKPLIFKRSPLRVTVEVPADAVAKLLGSPTAQSKPYRLTLFVVHLKSGRDYGYEREAEAVKLVELVREAQAADAEANIIVLGDCNAQLAEKPLQVLTAGGLRDAFADRSPRDAATTTHSSGRTIDHILLTPAAFAEFLPDSRFVLGTIDRPAGVDWRTTPPPPGYASDHYPVVIDLWPADRPQSPLVPAGPKPAAKP